LFCRFVCDGGHCTASEAREKRALVHHIRSKDGILDLIAIIRGLLLLDLITIILLLGLVLLGLNLLIGTSMGLIPLTCSTVEELIDDDPDDAAELAERAELDAVDAKAKN
jgi:hypothetical protein